jgi:hypothetical protein
VLLKLMGLTYVFDATLRVIQMMSEVTLGWQIEGGPSVKLLAGFSLVGVLVTAGFAAAFLFLTQPLAGWLFDDDEQATEPLSAKEIVRAGIVLMGIYLVAMHVTTAAWFLGETLWHLEGSRQKLMRDFLGRSWRDFGSDLGLLAVGSVLCFRSREITNFLWNHPHRSATSAKDEDITEAS